MSEIERLEKRIKNLKIIDKLSKNNVEIMVIIKPLSEMQKSFLIEWKKDISILQIARNLKCSRPNVYKIMEVLSSNKIKEARENESNAV